VKCLSTLIVGIVSYLVFLVATLYAVSYTLGGLFPNPVSIPHAPPVLAVLTDVGVILIFGIQHSVMARARWKKLWTTIIPPGMERSLYVLIASGILLGMFCAWQPMPNTLWRINDLPIRIIINGICLAGWAIVLLSTFQIDHLELFGLRQMWQSMHRQPELPVEFRRPLLYRFVRHPMMVGFLVVFWATPTMTVDRLIFALGMTVYILIGISFEEHALRRQFGMTYEKYRAEVPQLIPFARRLHRFFWARRQYARSGSATNTQR
jgi:protein-S-isoprenylcysteine O-methyltransferase Ste14